MSKTVSKPGVRRRKLAESLIDVMTFLISSADTEDFSAGYSISEAISDRLGDIGRLSNAKKLFGTPDTDLLKRRLETSPSGLPTRQAELLTLREYGLEAIRAARDVAPTDELTEEELDKEADELLNDPYILLGEG